MGKALIVPELREPASLSDLPRATGVYRLYDREERLIYIGKSLNIRDRISGHFSCRETVPKELKLFNQCAYIRWTLTGSELIALLLESDEIKLHQPSLNRAQRRTSGFWALALRQDPRSEYFYTRVEPLRVDNEDIALWTFSSRGVATTFAQEFYKEHGFCERLSLLSPTGRFLYTVGRGCFLQQIDRCLGACTGAEVPSLYNERFLASLSGSMRLHGSFAVLDRGRSASELSFALVENSTYRGFGYFPKRSKARLSTPYLKKHLQPRPDTKDARRILAGYLLKPDPTLHCLEKAEDRAPRAGLRGLDTLMRQRLTEQIPIGFPAFS